MNRRNIIIIISILAFIVIVGGVSYSYFIYNKDVGDINLDTGSISINLSNVSGNQTLTNVIPLSDNEGKTTSDYFDFTVTGTVDTERIYYEVYLLPKENNTIDTSYIKTYLTDQSNNEISQIFLYDDLANSEKEDAKAIYRGVIETNANGTTQNYSKAFRLRIWLDESYEELQSKTFEFDIYLYAKNVDDNFVLNAAPTIDSCPGCEFIFTTNTYNYGQNGSTRNDIAYNNDVLVADYTSLNKNHFLGFKIENDVIVKAYACGIKEDSPNPGTAFCIEGSTDGTTFNSNVSLITGATLWNDPDFTADRCYHITVVDDNVYCHSGLLYTSVNEFGWCSVEDNSISKSCLAQDDGTASCD